MNITRPERLGEGRTCWPDEGMAELSLLLPGSQAAALEKLAYARGLTLGQLLRLLIGAYLTRESDPGAPSERERPGGK